MRILFAKLSVLSVELLCLLILSASAGSNRADRYSIGTTGFASAFNWCRYSLMP